VAAAPHSVGGVDQPDRALRNLTYGLLAELGRVPGAGEVAARAGTGVDAVLAGWARLHDAHALVLDQGGESIRMAHPFSGVPTPYRVHAAHGQWYANCAWDAFGVCAALNADGRIETACADCGEPIEVAVRDRAPGDDTLLFHCLVPAARWWEDIVFT
jgi:hypothetical protein